MAPVRAGSGNPREQAPRALITAREAGRTLVQIPDVSENLNRDGDGAVFTCPGCGKTGNRLAYGDGGRPLCKCWVCELDYVDALGITVEELLAEPWKYLAEYATGVGSHERKPDALPNEAKVAGWASRLLAEPGLLQRLRRERGLTLETVKQFEIGWCAVKGGYTVPIRNGAGELVNVSWRAPKGQSLTLPSRRSKHRLAGRTAELGMLPLYPDVPPSGPLLVTEGEPDTLLARQNGLPAVTGLLGKQWHSAWDLCIVGRRVAVAYDVAAEEEATKTVEHLLAAGAAEAWVVALGLPMRGDDIGDWFLRYGKTADELRTLIKRARRAA